MGKINIASWALGLGAVGQSLMLGNTVKQVPSWLVLLPLPGPQSYPNDLAFSSVSASIC